LNLPQQNMAETRSTSLNLPQQNMAEARS